MLKTVRKTIPIVEKEVSKRSSNYLWWDEIEILKTLMIRKIRVG